MMRATPDIVGKGKANASMNSLNTQHDIVGRWKVQAATAVEKNSVAIKRDAKERNAPTSSYSSSQHEDIRIKLFTQGKYFIPSFAMRLPQV